MLKCIFSAVMAMLLLFSIALDSSQWARPYSATATPRSRINTTGYFVNEAQHVYQFSGAADGVRLENGRIVLNDNVAGNDIELFEGGVLTVDAGDIVNYSYDYTVTIEGDMVFVLDAGTLGNLGATFSIINEYMGITSAKTGLYEDKGITAEALIDTLTFCLTLTHADGTVTTHSLPLTVTPASIFA